MRRVLDAQAAAGEALPPVRFLHHGPRPPLPVGWKVHREEELYVVQGFHDYPFTVFLVHFFIHGQLGATLGNGAQRRDGGRPVASDVWALITSLFSLIVSDA